MELTPEERQRIYLEEKARVEARGQLLQEAERKKLKKSKRWLLWILGIIFVPLIIGRITERQATLPANPDIQSVSAKSTAAAPDGFRDVKWGSTSTARLKKYSGPTSDGITMYLPASFKIKPLPPLFDCEVAEEAYSFSYGKFFSGSAWFDGKANFEKVKAALVSTYGQPSFTNEKLAFWKWKWPGKIEVQLTYQAKFSRTTVTFLNDAI